ncbi:hypothetical protein CYMTET_24327 [Cymbomonas tetramitiformis]|uniref:Mitotic spindle assembly checkpoint protein MAD1 n=1 Tax=Cymbomonas tetramitiformis TaxID=36881 RepID=A0AAE0FXF7_9CHLO|nr:hypothetical protein CYMTET_24327 [Cymbomonas tetramitiformis]
MAGWGADGRAMTQQQLRASSRQQPYPLAILVRHQLMLLPGWLVHRTGAVVPDQVLDGRCGAGSFTGWALCCWLVHWTGAVVLARTLIGHCGAGSRTDRALWHGQPGASERLAGTGRDAARDAAEVRSRGCCCTEDASARAKCGCAEGEAGVSGGARGGAEKGITGLAAAEARAAAAEQSLVQWNSELIKLPGITHPSHLATKLMELQREAALAADKAGEKAAAAAIAAEAQKAAETDTALLAEKLRAQQAALDAAMETGHRAERQAALLQQEVESVQRRLISCQHELAVRGPGAAAVGRVAPTGGAEASEDQRVGAGFQLVQEAEASEDQPEAQEASEGSTGGCWPIAQEAEASEINGGSEASEDQRVWCWLSPVLEARGKRGGQVVTRLPFEELEASLSLVRHYLPKQTETQLKQADAAVHQSATSAAEARKEVVAGTQRADAAEARVRSLESEAGALAKVLPGLQLTCRVEGLPELPAPFPLLLEHSTADAAEARVRSLESEAGALAKEVAVLEKKVGGGDFNRATTKVLHFKMNPETETHQTDAEKEVIALRTENKELKASLINLEKRKGDPMDSDELRAEGGVAVGSAALAVAQAQHTVLEQRVAELEKREVRYKAVFKEQITNFREACFRLFGYKVDMQTEQGKGKVPLVAITSMFAVSNNEQLIFKLTQGGSMELQPNAYSMQPEMQKQVDTFVTKFRSIPAFIANLTMELFNKNTLQ